MEAVYPAAASALTRGRRARRAGLRARHRTTPVTFAEIKEVDEEKEEECAPALGSGSGERRRPDLLDERLARQFSEFRRRRRRDALPEPPDEPSEPAAPPAPPAPAAHPAHPAPAAHPAHPAPAVAGPALRAGSEPREPR